MGLDFGLPDVSALEKALPRRFLKPQPAELVSVHLVPHSDVQGVLFDGQPLVGVPDGELCESSSPDSQYVSNGRTSRVWASCTWVKNPFDLWLDLVQRFPSTGLWPVLSRDGAFDVGDGQVPSETPSDSRAEEILNRSEWPILPEYFGEERLAPISIHPRISPRRPLLADRTCRAHLDIECCLLLVAVRHPWEVFSVIEGPYNEKADVVPSWERRFGAVPFTAESAQATLAVLDPPDDRREAANVAREVSTWCFDFMPDSPPRSMDEAVELVVSERYWQFWWD